MAYKYKWKLDKIMIYPFGGCVFFDSKINRSLKEELFILLMGPFTQVILYLIVTILFRNNIVSFRNYEIFRNYHYILLIFNLLPIYPLDGGRLVNIIFNYIFPYRKGNILVIYLSYIFVLLTIIYVNNFNYLFMGLVLIIEIYLYYIKQDNIYNKFLLERYLYNYKFKRLKIINNINNMYRERRHIIKSNNSYITEKDYLKKMFGDYNK